MSSTGSGVSVAHLSTAKELIDYCRLTTYSSNYCSYDPSSARKIICNYCFIYFIALSTTTLAGHSRLMEGFSK